MGLTTPVPVPDDLLERRSSSQCSPENAVLRAVSEPFRPIGSPCDRHSGPKAVAGDYLTGALACLRIIYQAQSATRRLLADRTRLGSARVSAVVTQLIARRLVQEKLLQEGMRGRPVGVLSLNPEAGRLLGLDIGGELTRAVITDATGNILASEIWPTEAVPDRTRILDNIERQARAVCWAASCPCEELLAVGAGARAIVDARTSVVLNWPDTPTWMAAWAGLDLGAELASRLGVRPAVVDDSVRTMGVNAHRTGPARSKPNFLYVHVGSGVGATLFLDGRPYRAAAGISGEIGHVTVDEHGPWCSCGNRGCLETMVSKRGVLRRVRERLAKSHIDSTLRTAMERDALSVEALLEAAAAGDKIAYQILDETGGYLGRVLAMALNLLGTDLVVIAGPFARPDSIVMEAVRRQVRLRALRYISQQVAIVCDDECELSGARGAALLALDTLLTDDACADMVQARLTSR